jgi:cell division protein FtsI/penicillin-binding protein 2
MKKSHHSGIFVLRTDNTYGHLSQRHEMEDLEYAVSNTPFSETLSNTRHIGSVVSNKRVRVGLFVFFLFVFLFAGKAAHLQIMEGNHYRALAEGNRYRTQRILPQRGQILDRNGVVLTENIPSFILTMTITDLPKDETERRTLFDYVSALAGIQPTDLDLLLTQFSSSQNEPIPVKRNIAFEPAMHLAIEAKKLPGFGLETASVGSAGGYGASADQV